MAKQYSFDEVKKNNDNKKSWIVVHNNVYDVTPFLNEVSGRIFLIKFVSPTFSFRNTFGCVL